MMQYGYPQQPPYQPRPEELHNKATFAHLSGLLGLLLTVSFAGFLGPLIFWLLYKDRPGYEVVRVAAAGAFNFNLAMWLINLAAWVVTLITLGIGAIVTVPIMCAGWLVTIIFHIVAAVRANKGEVYRYPLRVNVLS
ncbi:MAG: DUF4870 domain-containing protein [Rothia sp. (in: high G+C Gram-positive bacteria)]|nr:DUF4870 domain-containing protein [Rothia sp. (in: high G+C Gram-positive bacteria)]